MGADPIEDPSRTVIVEPMETPQIPAPSEEPAPDWEREEEEVPA